MRTFLAFMISAIVAAVFPLAAVAQNGEGVYDPTTNTCMSSNGLSVTLGQSGDIPVTGDFDGDGLIDCGTYRPSDATWTIYYSSTQSIQTTVAGDTNATPIPGDYDGDGITDLATFAKIHNEHNTRYVILLSSSDQTMTYDWGTKGDIPVRGDFDGDGIDDFAVFRSKNSVLKVSLSGGEPEMAVSLGNSNSIPVSGDFDGDGIADPAVDNQGIVTDGWIFVDSSDGVQHSGSTSLPPASADYDGDGITDPAGFTNGVFFINESTAGDPVAPDESIPYGASGDIPLTPAPLSDSCAMISQSSSCDPE